MDLGMPTLLELSSLEENALLCAELGLSFVELNMNLPQYQTERLDARQLREIGAKYGIYFTLHLDENFDPCNFNFAVADAYRRTMARAIEFSIKAGIPLINMHMNHGVYFKLPREKVYLYGGEREHYADRLKTLREECEAAIGGEKILICVENTDGFQDFETDVIRGLLESEKFALTLDIGHAHAAAYADQDFYDSNHAKVRHIHCHDARGESNHLPLGEGDVDFRKIFALATRNACRIVIEVKASRELRESVKFLRNGGIGDAVY